MRGNVAPENGTYSGATTHWSLVTECGWLTEGENKADFCVCVCVCEHVERARCGVNHRERRVGRNKLKRDGSKMLRLQGALRPDGEVFISSLFFWNGGSKNN